MGKQENSDQTNDGITVDASISDETEASTQGKPEPEVRPVKKRKYRTAAYKLRILEELDACTELGQRGALLRREGLYSSQITAWRRSRETGTLSGLSQKKWRKAQNPEGSKRVSQLEKENARLKKQLAQAQIIMDIQKKVSSIFGESIHETVLNESK